MKKFLYVPQEQCIESWLSLSSCIILLYIVDLSSWANTIEEEEETYYQLNVGKVLKDLPILWIKSKQGILDRMKELITKDFIKKVVVKNKPYYRPTNKTASLLWIAEEREEKEGSQDSLTPWQEGVQSTWDKCKADLGLGVKKSWDNSIVNIESIYSNYMTIVPKDKKKWNKSAQAKLYISQLLKEWFTKEQLESSIRNYKNKTESKYIMASQYFFSNTKQWKHYRPFIDYMAEWEKVVDVKEMKVELF